MVYNFLDTFLSTLQDYPSFLKRVPAMTWAVTVMTSEWLTSWVTLHSLKTSVSLFLFKLSVSAKSHLSFTSQSLCAGNSVLNALLFGASGRSFSHLCQAAEVDLLVCGKGIWKWD